MNFWILDDMVYEESRDVMGIAGRARQAGKTEMLTIWYKQAIKELCKIAKETNVPIITATQKPLDLGMQCTEQDCLASILKDIDFSKSAQTEAKEVTPLDIWCKDMEAYLNKIVKEKTMKYKIGDRVRVISKQEARKLEGVPDYQYAPLMYNFCDYTVTISDIEKGKYRIKEDQGVWCWRDADFVGLAEEIKETQMPVYGTTKEKTMTKQELLDKIAKLKKEQQEAEAQLKKLPKYPCIKKNTVFGIIVLFTKKNTGVVIGSTDDCFKLGYSNNDWNEDSFTVEYNAFTVKVGE